MQAQIIYDPNNNPVNRWLTNAHTQQDALSLTSEMEDDLEFQDANEDFFGQDCSLDEAFLDAKRALDLFFENKFEEAINICEKYLDVSPVHGMMLTFFNTFFALFSLAKDDLDKASAVLDRAIPVNNRFRKQNSFSQNVSNFFFKPNLTEYTEEEMYCELVAAYYDLTNFLMILFGEQSIITLIKAAIKIRACSNHIKFCEDLYASRKHWENKKIQIEFEAALFVGSGVLNLVFSHLPSRVMALLSMIGFGCDRRKGIDFLDQAFYKRNTLPNVFAGYMIMFYNLYVEQIFGLGEGNIEWAKSISKNVNFRYPKSICGIFFTARIKQVMGKPLKAIQNFERVTSSQDIKCNNIANICYWDMIWCYAMLGDYQNAARIARLLSDICSWSPATNMYQCAVFTYAQAVKTGDKELLAQVEELMAAVPAKRIRYAGKTIPLEKFAISRAEAYMKDHYLPVPHLEIFYVWNIFCNANGKSKILNPMLNEIDTQLAQMRHLLSDPHAKLDHYGLLLKLKAGVLRSRRDYDQAIRCLNQIFHLQNRMNSNNYILPNAACDLGLNYVCLNEFKKAEHWLNSARSDYSGYLAEMIVHFRVHNALRHLRIAESGLEEEQQLRTFVKEMSDSDDSGDEGFEGSNGSAAGSEHLGGQLVNSSSASSVRDSEVSEDQLQLDNLGSVDTLDGLRRSTSTFGANFRRCSVDVTPGPLKRSAVSSCCVGTLQNAPSSGRKALARGLGGGSVNGLGSELTEPLKTKGKNRRPILQRMKKKIARTLRPQSQINIEQQVIQKQLEDDLKKTRQRSGSNKQLKRRFTDWF